MAGWPLALNPGANQYTGPARGAKKCFIAAAAAGDITNAVNKADGMGQWAVYLIRCLCQYYNFVTK